MVIMTVSINCNNNNNNEIVTDVVAGFWVLLGLLCGIICYYMFCSCLPAIASLNTKIVKEVEMCSHIYFWALGVEVSRFQA